MVTNPVMHPAGNVIVKIYDRKTLVFSTPLTRALDVGRQQQGEAAPFCRVSGTDGDRVIVANLEDKKVSRSHALLNAVAEGHVTVTNRSSVREIALDHDVLAPGQTTQIKLPAVLRLGELAIRVENVEPQQAQLEGLPYRTLAPGHQMPAEGSFHDVVPGRAATLDSSQLLAWMQSAMTVFQSAATSADFLDKAAAAAAELVDLDHAAVLLQENGEWAIAASGSRDGNAPAADWRPSHSILVRMQEEKRTFRQLPARDGAGAPSLADVAALVSAPVLDRNGEVIGALYGDRQSTHRTGSYREITEAEATLVDLLACSLAAGLARVEQEQAALAARVQFEQFFTPQLARQLEEQPDLLTGRDMDVTILFCDISGFSRISERLGPGRTVAWVSDVMAALSDCVIEHEGVLVDYIGDELMAMWGAPVEESNHPALACVAAIDMMRCLPRLNEKWQPILGEPVAMGVGIDTGPAHVGNTGSPRKFKYGPLGNTVNLASRVQGATRYLKSRLLITGSTAERLPADFPVRRLCQVRVVNIDKPVDLYELAIDATDTWHALKAPYEEALAAFEGGDALRATRILGNLAADHPDDQPALILLSRAVDALAARPASYDPLWVLPGK